MKKKGQINLQNLTLIVSLLVVAGLIAAFSADVADDIQDGFRSGDDGFGCTNEGGEGNCTSAQFNVSGNTVLSITNITDQFGNTGTVIGAGLIIGILLTAFVVGRGGVQFR